MAEVTPENGTELNGQDVPGVADVVDHRGLRGFDPPMHEAVGEGLREIARVLAERRPTGITAVVAWTPVSWKKRPEEIELLTFASEELREEWDVLDPMAEAIGPIFGQLPFTPVTKPVSARQWRQAAAKRDEAPGWRHVTHRGVLLYSWERAPQLA